LEIMASLVECRGFLNIKSEQGELNV
jgi:hypothetical protein